MIVATATPEQPLPHTGAFIGEALGLRCGSFDLSGRVRRLRLRARRRQRRCCRPAYDHVLHRRRRDPEPDHRPDDRTTTCCSATAPAPRCSAHDRNGRDCSRGISAATVRPPGSLEIPAGGSRLPADARRPSRPRALPEDGGPGSVPTPCAHRRRVGERTLERGGCRPKTCAGSFPHQANGAASSKPPPSASVLVSDDRTLVQHRPLRQHVVGVDSARTVRSGRRRTRSSTAISCCAPASARA